MIILQLIYWKIVDLRRLLREGRKLHLYGIIGIVGLYGGGKTMALTRYLEDVRNKHGDNVYIATNYFYKGQDFSLDTWRDMLRIYDKPIIFGYDELQNEFNSREYKSFPVSLMTILTQNRKGNGKQIIYTTQDYETVDKSFRRLTQWIWACKTRFGRLTSVRVYDREDYEMLISTPEVNKRMRIKPMKSWKFVQTDYIRDCYDSYQMLDSALNKTYVEQLHVVNE